MTLSTTDKAILYVKQWHKVLRLEKALRQAQRSFSKAMKADLELTVEVEQGILYALEREVIQYA